MEQQTAPAKGSRKISEDWLAVIIGLVLVGLSVAGVIQKVP